MVDLCRPSTLPANGSIVSSNGDNDSHNGNANFFPSLFVSIDISIEGKMHSFNMFFFK